MGASLWVCPLLHGQLIGERRAAQNNHGWVGGHIHSETRSVGKLKMYLKAKVSKYELEHSENPDKSWWSLSTKDYFNYAVKDMERE
jgi:hypothetical protein